MFSRILIENDVRDYPVTQTILERFPQVATKAIDKVDDIFGRVKKPYLQKRDNLQLFLGKKRGTKIKLAPDAYGLAGEPHYYFIHAYNCIYECEYCYLQGHFQSPDIVLFLNHDEIGEEIEKTINKNGKNPIWFHAGEFSDSLALTHLTGELPFYFELFKKYPQAKLELRTKSANTRELEKLDPLPNVITSFSLSPAHRIRSTDLKTPPLKGRLAAMKRLADRGHALGIHFDPVIHEDNFESCYRELIQEICETLPLDSIQYISIGVVRFTSNVFHQVKKNYPESELLAAEFTSSFDGKIRYPRPFRLWILGKIKDLCLQQGIDEEKIYLCME